MLEGFLLNGNPITQDVYTELCARFPDKYGYDAERLPQERRELKERTLRELTQSASFQQTLSQVSLTQISTPSFTPSSKPSSATQILPSPSLMVIDEEREHSPEVPESQRRTGKLLWEPKLLEPQEQEW